MAHKNLDSEFKNVLARKRPGSTAAVFFVRWPAARGDWRRVRPMSLIPGTRADVQDAFTYLTSK